MLFSRAKSGTIIIPNTDDSYILEFDKTIYDLTLDFSSTTLSGGQILLDIFKVKINDGDAIKLYGALPIQFNNIEIYKIEFIRQCSIGEDINVEYQGFVRR